MEHVTPIMANSLKQELSVKTALVIVLNVKIKILVNFVKNLIYSSMITVVEYVILIMACLLKTFTVSIVLLIVLIV